MDVSQEVFVGGFNREISPITLAVADDGERRIAAADQIAGNDAVRIVDRTVNREDDMFVGCTAGFSAKIERRAFTHREGANRFAAANVGNSARCRCIFCRRNKLKLGGMFGGTTERTAVGIRV